jgi:S1-C subfamily serine protease
MRSLTIIRFLAPALLCLCGGHALAAAGNWELFATSSTTKVYFDRGSVKEAEGYVHYNVRIEYGQTRETRDKKYRYQSTVNGQAAQCDASKFAVTSITLFDGAGVRLAGSSRERERWEETLKEVEAGGVQAKILQHACALARGENPPTPGLKIQARPAGKITIGAGIVATRDGMIVTNHHVVDGCSSIFVMDPDKKRTPAERLASDAKNDLALIRANRSFAEVAAFRKDSKLQAGESVTVVGYPLASILGTEPNVTFGYVSAIAGPRGDAATFQISAPIHKGNSGGPILDQGGNVTGIVSSKLNALLVQKRTGDLPQNISFGVKAEVAQTFLDAQSVEYESSAAKPKLENTEVAAIGRAITVLVACRKVPSAADESK